MQNHQHYLSQNYRNLEWEKCVSIVGNTYNLGEFLKLRSNDKGPMLLLQRFHVLCSRKCYSNQLIFPKIV